MKILISLSLIAILAANACAVVFSEIMLRPAVGEEWIELYNETESPVDISGWVIIDRAGNDAALPDAPLTMEPYAFAVLSKDSTTLLNLDLNGAVLAVITDGWAALNNDGDEIVLYDSSGSEIDRMGYGRDPGKQKGRSYERIYDYQRTPVGGDWGLCVAHEGHTAGKSNSLKPSLYITEVNVWAEPNPFNPQSGGEDAQTFIHYRLPASQSRITIDAYNTRGLMIRRIASNMPVGSTSPAVPWDGRTDNGKMPPIGRYIIVLQSVDVDGGKIYTGRCTVVLAGKL